MIVDRYNFGIAIVVLVSSSLLAWGGTRIERKPPEFKTPICHAPIDGSPYTICVNNSIVDSFIEYGDTLGPCDGDIYFKSCHLAGGHDYTCWDN